MKLKKQYGSVKLCFDVLNNKIDIASEIILIDILNSLDNFAFINRDQPFDELLKKQQKYKKYILVSFEPTEIDALKFKVNAVNNFLSATNQTKFFMLNYIEEKIGDATIVIDGLEVLREKFDDSVSFSPTIRTEWSNPLLSEKIIKRN